METSDTIRSWRLDRSLSQADAAKALGVPVRTLQQWEQGRQEPSKWRAKELEKRMREWKK